MSRRFDVRTFVIILIAGAAGLAWAVFNYLSTGGQRGDGQLRALVWTIFATPLCIFIGWAAARRAELWRAAFVSFCVYFFTPFVAARYESLLMTQEQAAASGRNTYFTAVLALHGITAVGLAVWRALSPPAAPAGQEAPAERSSPRAG